MTAARVLDRLRAVNPAPATTIDDDQLRESIITTPGDPRLIARQTRRSNRGRWLQTGGRQLALLAVVVGLGAAGAAAAVTTGAIRIAMFSHASPSTLFRANPAAIGSPSSWRQHLVAGSVHRIETLTVPGVGKFEYWIAQTTQHGLCQAIRLPDGGWAGEPGRKIAAAGLVPGCLPRPAQGAMSSGPMGPGLINGFFYWTDTVWRQPHGRPWRIVYGIALTHGHGVKVRDAINGATTPILDGRYFAMVLPQRNLPPRFGVRPYFQLETINASGQVLSKAPLNRGE